MGMGIHLLAQVAAPAVALTAALFLLGGAAGTARPFPEED
jgi:hypothetical protein